MKFRMLITVTAAITGVAGTFLAASAPRRTDVTAQQIFDAVAANLLNVGAMTADVSCVCSNPVRSFADGYLVASGLDRTFLDEATVDSSTATIALHTTSSTLSSVAWPGCAGMTPTDTRTGDGAMTLGSGTFARSTVTRRTSLVRPLCSPAL